MSGETELPLLSTAVAEGSAGGGSDTEKVEATTGSEAVKVDEVKAAETPAAEVKQVSNVPEKYDFKLPEGENINQERLTEVSDVFKKLGLNQEQAQTLMDYNLKLSKTSQDEQIKAFEAVQKGWAEESIKELGAEAPKRMAIAAKARDTFGSKELTQILVDSGLEKNIHVIKFFEAIGKTISEDSMVEGKATNGVDLSKLSPRERLEYTIQKAQDEHNKK
jgi:hypothetical protein